MEALTQEVIATTLQRCRPTFWKCYMGYTGYTGYTLEVIKTGEAKKAKINISMPLTPKTV